MTDEDRGGAVAVAYAHSNTCSMSWHHSMMQLLNYDLAHNTRVFRGGWVATRCGTNGLTEARNLAVREFLKGEPRLDWMFWVDTDMGFEPDIIDRLMEVADPVERPMVGALAFSMRELGQDGLGGWRVAPTPTLFDWGEDEGKHGFMVRFNYDRNTVTRVAGTGSACVLIHRSVFERCEEKYGTWYDRIPNTETGQLIGEDLSFCMRLGALDIPIYVHTGVETNHEKTIWIKEEVYIEARVVDTWKAEQPKKNGQATKKLEAYGLK